MTTVLLTTVVFGEVALLLDLAGRLFGTYARTPLRAAARTLAVTVAGCAFMGPAMYSLAFEEGKFPTGLWVSGGLGAIVIVHLLFPMRFGIRRGVGDGPVRVEPLVRGVRVRRETFASPALPEAADGLECLVLSDFHCNTRGKLALLQAIGAALKEEPADCVFVLGDLGEKNGLLPEIMAAIGGIPARWGKYLVRSNHDFEGGRQEIVERLAREHSIRVLANDTCVVPELGICLVGLESPWNTEGEPAIEESEFAMGLSHTPDNLIEFVRLRVPVAVAGHTHGGKVWLPLIGALLVPSRFGRLLDYGWFVKDGCRMFVTKGIGYFPGVCGSWGEVVRMRLERGE